MPMHPDAKCGGACPVLRYFFTSFSATLVAAIAAQDRPSMLCETAAMCCFRQWLTASPWSRTVELLGSALLRGSTSPLSCARRRVVPVAGRLGPPGPWSAGALQRDSLPTLSQEVSSSVVSTVQGEWDTNDDESYFTSRRKCCPHAFARTGMHAREKFKQLLSAATLQVIRD